MPIRVNLLAEALIAEDLRRRDPVKRAIFVCALIVALALAWWSYLVLQHMGANRELSRIQTETQQNTNQYDQVMTSMRKTADAKTKLADLQKLSAARFLQGNLMNALQQVFVPSVQLTRLRVDQEYFYTAGSPAQTNRFGVIGGRPAVVTEKITVLLDAKDFSANPGDQVNKYKDAIAKEPYWQSMLDQTNGIRLSSLSAQLTDTEGKPYVLFTLECHLLDKTR